MDPFIHTFFFPEFAASFPIRLTGPGF